MAAPLWGTVADRLGLTTCLLIAGAVMLLCAAGVRRCPLHDAEGTNPSPSDHWPAPPCCSSPERPMARSWGPAAPSPWTNEPTRMRIRPFDVRNAPPTQHMPVSTVNTASSAISG
ncbi:MFS transporter [Microtetraspora fusca]|uniref:MFS transporter n=1 Tax=Microtetraspora fusca TaxID=1997 RepID=UPI0035713B7B